MHKTYLINGFSQRQVPKYVAERKLCQMELVDNKFQNVTLKLLRNDDDDTATVAVVSVRFGWVI